MKNEILQTFSFYEYSDINIAFSIKTKQLDLPSLTDFLKLLPTRGWTNGEKYISKQLNTDTKTIEQVERQRSMTLFVYETKGLVQSTRFKEHAEHLIDKLTSIHSNLKTFINQPDNFEILIQIYLTLDKEESHFGFSVDSEILKKLTDFCYLIEWRKS